MLMFYCVMKGIQEFAPNLLICIPMPYVIKFVNI